MPRWTGCPRRQFKKFKFYIKILLKHRFQGEGKPMKKFLALAVLLTFCFLLTPLAAAGQPAPTSPQRPAPPPRLRPRTPPREPRASGMTLRVSQWKTTAKSSNILRFTCRPELLTRFLMTSASRSLNAAAMWKALRSRETITARQETGTLLW